MRNVDWSQMSDADQAEYLELHPVEIDSQQFAQRTESGGVAMVEKHRAFVGGVEMTEWDEDRELVRQQAQYVKDNYEALCAQ